MRIRDPEQAFFLNADPDSGSKINADPCGESLRKNKVRKWKDRGGKEKKA
jgi:hypothetical protein